MTNPAHETNDDILRALEPRKGDTVERIARRWLRAYIAEHDATPAHRVYVAAERLGLTVVDIKSAMKRSGLRYAHVNGTWIVRPATAAERDEARRVAIARHWHR
jgi:hypothetical protein